MKKFSFFKRLVHFRVSWLQYENATWKLLLLCVYFGCQVGSAMILTSLRKVAEGPGAWLTNGYLFPGWPPICFVLFLAKIQTHTTRFISLEFDLCIACLPASQIGGEPDPLFTRAWCALKPYFPCSQPMLLLGLSSLPLRQVVHSSTGGL